MNETTQNLIARATAALTSTVFAALLALVEQSFQVPQFGPYHNEGPTMLFHLNLMLRRIEEVMENLFPEEIPEDIRDMLRRAVQTVPMEILVMYVFLHDIDKTTSLYLKFEDKGQDDLPLTLKFWIKMLRGDEDGIAFLAGDTNALSRYCSVIGLRAIGYQGHGKAAADRLQALDSEGKWPALITMVRYHEVAFQFDRVNIPTYEDYFGTMDSEERDMCLLASFIDTAASLRENGRPDFKNFLFFARSRLAAEAFDKLNLLLQDVARIDEHELSKALAALKKSPTAFQEQSADEVFKAFVQKFRLHTYDDEMIRKALAPIAKDGLSENIIDELVYDLSNHGKIRRETGRKLQRFNRPVRDALMNMKPS